MNKNLKPQILQLRAEGKSYNKIRAILKCSASTIAYHLSEQSKISTHKRYEKSVKNGQKQLYNKRGHSKPKSALSLKITQFHRLGKGKYKILCPRNFSTDDLLSKLTNNSKCYLTGCPIDLSQSSTYSLDHIIPASKGGENTLNNLGLCTSDVNRAKSNKTPEEFIELCKKVLEYNRYQVQKISI